MGTRFQDSFGALYMKLERPMIARRVIAVLLVIHTFLLGYSGYVHSPTLNEPGHLVAGLSHWEFGRFDVYNVNPPLVKIVAALPVMIVGYEQDWSGFSDALGARPERGMGADFILANQQRSNSLFTLARWACIPFSWTGAIACYLWARDLYGRPAGVTACAIWCFEPNILAHASLITPDAHAAAISLAACYTFWRWLRKPTWFQSAITGVILGLAELAKTTLILFYPLWPLIWLVYRWPSRRRIFGRDWLREAGMLVLRFVIAFYVLNLGYGFEGTLMQLKHYCFVSDLFTGSRNGSRSEICNSKPRNRFAKTWVGELPVPFPKNYLLGIDIQQRDFERGKRSYLCGEWRDRGWWYYYLYACAIKIPLGLWMLGLLALVARVHARSKMYQEFATAQETSAMPPDSASLSSTRPNLVSYRDELMVLFPAITIFIVVSAKTGFSEHFRYVLPCLPFFFVWLSAIAKLSFDKPPQNVQRVLPVDNQETKL